MKQRILYIFTAAAAIFSFFACTNEKMVISDKDLNDDIQLKLVLPALTSKAGESNLTDGEKRIGNIDFFIFKTEDYEAGNVAASYHGVITNSTTADSLAGTYTVTLENMRSDILGTGVSEGKVIAIANYTFDAAAKPTKAALDAMEAGNTFAVDTGSGYYHPKADKDQLFIMRGDADIAMVAGSGVSATVEMKRLASKITVKLVFPENGVPVGDITWKADLGEVSEARVYITNASKTSTLAGAPSTDYIEYVYDYLKDYGEGEVPVYYTYPVSTPTDDHNRMFIKVVVPWFGYNAAGAIADQMECYYKIFIPDANTETADVADVTGNLWYDITANINTIGPGIETLIQASYIVKDWNNLGEISSNVASGNYLSLDVAKLNIDAYATLTQIAYAASGPVRARIKNIYQYNYTASSTDGMDHFAQNNEIVASETLMGKKNIPDTTTIRNWVRLETSGNRNLLVIDHAMQNDISDIKSFDAAPYVFEIELILTDAPNPTYNKTITVTQYPAMYIISEQSTVRQNTNQYQTGYVFINSTSYNGANLVNSGNVNTHMFIVTSTVLSSEQLESGTMLGDPRLKTIQNYYNNNDQNWSIPAAAMDGPNRRLTYYYPSDPSTSAAKIISPKFRVASSYGATLDLDREGAWERCAGYQEDGYPAGRWRIPTTSEINYITKLSTNGFMDYLFGYRPGSPYYNSDAYYWSASGVVNVRNDTGKVTEVTSASEAAVRCVYDDWYWTDKCDRTTFTWGDKTRAN